MKPVDILVVEDESIVAMDIRNCLEGHGYNVLGCVASGEEAIDRIRADRPDLVLMDIRLQGEMSGIEAARCIMETFHVPSLFLTSYVDGEMLRQAKGLNAVGYLLKPFEDRELGVAVEMALYRWQVESELRQALEAAGDKGRGVEERVPTLTIRTLGVLEIVFNGQVVARAEDLSRSLRNLLALLMTSPQMRISKDEIQLALWPESTPEKARSSFDSLLLRLRKTMDAFLRPFTVGDYLCLQRGILCLDNCRIDVVEFQLAARRGLELMKRKNAEAARNSFAEALDLWAGSFVPGVSEVERLHEFKDSLERLYVETVLAWSQMLLDEEAYEEAVQVLLQALPYDRVNDDLVRALYGSYVATNNPAKAGEVLRQYQTALWRSGFSSKEIQEIVLNITTPG